MGDPAIAGTHCCWDGVVGGVKNSSSLEVSETEPIVSGHLQNHFQTAALTRLTWSDAMLREEKTGAGFHRTRRRLEWQNTRRKKCQ